MLVMISNIDTAHVEYSDDGYQKEEYLEGAEMQRVICANVDFLGGAGLSSPITQIVSELHNIMPAFNGTVSEGSVIVCLTVCNQDGSLSNYTPIINAYPSVPFEFRMKRHSQVPILECIGVEPSYQDTDVVSDHARGVIAASIEQFLESTPKWVLTR